MAEITSLTSVLKSNIGLNDYFVIANSSTKKARKLAVQSLFPTLTTKGTGGESLWSAITNQNQINLKGIKSGDTGLLTVTTTDDNLVLTVLEAGIDLSLCNNDTAGFLSTVNLSAASGTLGVNRGGTGLTTLAKGSVIYASALDTVTSTPLSSNGEILIGNGTSGYPQAGTITSTDSTLTITNGAGTIDLSVASTNRLSSSLDCQSYNINLNDAGGDSFLSGDGTAEGVHVDADGRVFIGDSTPTIPTLSSTLTVGGQGQSAIVVGNTNDYGSRTISFATSASGTAGADCRIEGADAGGGAVAGGDLTLEAGTATSSGVGGDLNLQGGTFDGGSGGAINLSTYGTKSSATPRVSIANSGAITMSGMVGFGIGFSMTIQAVTATGSSISDAAQISATGGNFVNATAADNTKAVKMPALSAVDAGSVFYIFNNAASNTLEIFPTANDRINPASDDAAITIAADTIIMLIALDANEWVGAELPVIAA
jgi:hypothetical protein